MKNLTSFAVFGLFAATLAMAAFGFTLMSEPGHTMGCLGILPGADCSSLPPLAHFVSHLDAFEGASTGVVPFVSALVLLLLAAFFFARAVAGSSRAIKAESSFSDREEHSSAAPFRGIVRWLALHERRDPSLAFAVNR